MKENWKKRVLITGAVLVAAVSLLSGGYFTLRKGVYAGDEFYYRISDSRYEKNKTNYIERISGNEFKIVSGADEKYVSVRLSDGTDSVTFNFSDGFSVTGFWNGQDFTDSDGLPVGWDEIQVSIGDAPVRLSNTAYCQTLSRIQYGEEETISAWYIQAFGVLIYVLGILSVLYPDTAHFFLSRWRYKDPELSEAGRFLEQAGGLTVSALGAGIMSGAVFLVTG